MTAPPTLLKVLLQKRHWQDHDDFRREYDKAAQRIDRSLVGYGPSRTQFYRWLAGDVKGLPYPGHCQVLEEMFPGWTVQQLLEPVSTAGDPAAHRPGARPENAGHTEDVQHAPPPARVAEPVTPAGLAAVDGAERPASGESLIAELLFRQGPLPADYDPDALTEWLRATNASDEQLERLAWTATSLAEAHAQVAPGQVLADVLAVHAKTHNLLRGGKQRLRQTRELLRIDGDLLAHACLLLGDLGDDHIAESYGEAALLYLREAEAAQDTAWYALAKTARWRHRYAQAADLARQGYEQSQGPMRVQLACYEANAAALLGDHSRARNAMTRAERAAQALPPSPSRSPWAFPDERMAIFRLSVALRTGDPDRALEVSADSDTRLAADEPHLPAAWAQIKIGGAIAHLLKDSLDGAAQHLAPVLTLSPEFRIATVTGWLTDLDNRLAQPRYATSPIAATLRQQIREFRSLTPQH